MPRLRYWWEQQLPLPVAGAGVGGVAGSNYRYRGAFCLQQGDAHASHVSKTADMEP